MVTMNAILKDLDIIFYSVRTLLQTTHAILVTNLYFVLKPIIKIGYLPSQMLCPQSLALLEKTQQ